jgi:hypothetical protein
VSQAEAKTVIDKLEEKIHLAKRVPLTDELRLNKNELYAVVDELREALGLKEQQQR